MGEFDRWSNLRYDFLNEIAKRLYSYDDYVRFRFVCKGWNSELPKIPDHKRKPWLVIPDNDFDKTLVTHLEEKEIYHVFMPELKDNCIRGFCYGWLICVMVSNGKVQMLNPFTKAYVDLPPISTFSDVKSFEPNIGLCGEYTLLADSDSGETYTVEARFMHQTTIWKVVISSPPDCDELMAVAIWGEFNGLALCRLNDKQWRDIPGPAKPMVRDAIFFQEKIYAVDLRAQLYVFDVKREPLPLLKISESLHPPVFRDVCANPIYLIGCDDGSLLMLMREVHWNNDNDNDEEDEDEYNIDQNEYIRDEDPDFKEVTTEFHMFKLNKNEKEWSQIYSLGDHVIMIGQNCSTRLRSNIFSDGKRNHIYYTDNRPELHSHVKPTRQDMGIFNLEDKTRDELLLNVKFLCAPTWLSY